MDRFKFRVFSKSRGDYVEKMLDLTIYYDGRLVEYDGLEQNMDNHIIEQCTGLKDKNGNLIYEGDIVVKSDTNALGYGRIRECNVHWHIDWLGWAITTEYGDTYALSEYASEQYEIIGNIHEQKDNK